MRNIVGKARRFVLTSYCVGFVLACQGNNDDDTFESVRLEQVVEPSDQDVRGEGPSPWPIALQWALSDPQRERTDFVASVTNNSAHGARVDLLLEGSGFHDLEAVSPLAVLVLASGETQDVPVTLDDMPLQSSGHPVTIRIGARYRLDHGKSEEVTTFSQALFVTSNTSFDAAFGRTMAEQAKENARSASLPQLLGRPTQMIRKTSSGAFESISLAGSETVFGPQVVLYEPPEFAIEPLSNHYAPDTEPRRKDL